MGQKALFESFDELTEFASFHILSILRDNIMTIRGVLIAIETERQRLNTRLAMLDIEKTDALEKQRKMFEEKRAANLKAAREREERTAAEINKYAQELLQAIVDERPEPEWTGDISISREAKERARALAAMTFNSAMIKR